MNTGTELLLINSPREIIPIRSSHVQDRRMPLGIMYMAAYLRRQGIQVAIIDAEALTLGISDLLSAIGRQRPKVLGLNCHTLNRHAVYEIVKAVKDMPGDILVIVGGPHPSLVPEATLRECPQIDAVVIGEGERVMHQICEQVGDISRVPGIAYIHNGAVRRNPPMERIKDLDTLPFPEPEDVPLDVYLEYEAEALPGLWHRAYLVASRGCRYRCTFCTEHSLWNTKVTFRSAANVLAEVERYRERYDIHRFYFYDDTLTDWPDLPLLCQAAAGSGIEWSCSTRIDHLDETRIAQMAAGGCREIAFGLESGSDKSLQQMRKGWQALRSKEDVGATLQLCNNYGIVPRTHFMIGFPWESRKDISETVQFAIALKSYSLTDANFFAVKVYPGTPFHQQVLQRFAGAPEEIQERIYNAWSVFDWFQTKNEKVATKLMRFNDIPEVSTHPNLDSLALRQLVRNAYELFFSDSKPEEVVERLWEGVAWREM